MVEDGHLDTSAVHICRRYYYLKDSEGTEEDSTDSLLTVCGILNSWSTICQLLMHHADSRTSQMPFQAHAQKIT